MRARLRSGVLFILIGSLTLFLATCDKTVNSGFEDSIKLYSYLEPIEGASNATMVVNKGKYGKDGYFQVEISDIATNHLLKSGTHGAWCLEWKKPMRSNNDEHKGVKWYSSIGNEKWRPMNYFFSIKGELEAADPDLTFREVQAVVWSLAGYMGIAPEFDVDKLPDSELPGRLMLDGKPNFSKEKVLAIFKRVKSEYASPTKSKASEEEGCIVGETEEDQQNVCVEPESGRIEIDPDPIVMSIGERKNISITVYDENNEIISDPDLFITISDESIANVFTRKVSSYIIDGKEVGETFINAESIEGYTATAKIIVNELEILSESITTGNSFSCGLNSSGAAYCWGLNSSGQLGNGTSTTSNVPVAVSMPDGVTFKTINAGGSHTVALDDLGRAWAWGENGLGQLGDGTTDQKLTPVKVSIALKSSYFSSISAGINHSLALTSNGRVLAWGFNSSGELGDGTSIMQTRPVAVSLPVGTFITSISAGDFHSVALDDNGKAWAWGNNSHGQIGIGNLNDQSTPVELLSPSGVVFTDIRGGGIHTLAMTDKGTIWAWGGNPWGQLGDGTFTQQTTPIEVTMTPGISFTKISTGNGHNIALDTEGNAWSWGWNGSGPVGNGTSTNQALPVQIIMPPGVHFMSISAGWDHSLAIDNNGFFWGWGGNRWGQVGDGTITNRFTPVEVILPLP